MLYLARADDPARHRGTVLVLEESVFAPPPGVAGYLAPETVLRGQFQVAYVEHLNALWKADPQLFLTLIDLATNGADLTSTDRYGEVDVAPRKILGATLKQIRSIQSTRLRKRARKHGG